MSFPTIGRAQFKPPAPLLCACALCVIPLGCSPGNNDRDSLGTTESPVVLETYAPTSVPGIATLDLQKGDVASIRSLDRGEWPFVVYTSPYSTVSHPASYSSVYTITESNLRQRGGYPLQVTATDTTNASGRKQQVLEAIANPFFAGIDLLFIPWKMTERLPWEADQSLAGPRIRGPRYGLDSTPAQTTKDDR